MKYRLFGRDLTSREPRPPLDVEADTEEAARAQAAALGMEVLQLEQVQPAAAKAGAGPDNTAKQPANAARWMNGTASNVLMRALLLLLLLAVFLSVADSQVWSGMLAVAPAWAGFIYGLFWATFLILISRWAGWGFLTEIKGPRERAVVVKGRLFLGLSFMPVTGAVVATRLLIPDLTGWVLVVGGPLLVVVGIVFELKKACARKDDGRGMGTGRSSGEARG
jgi:hypothetical protein